MISQNITIGISNSPFLLLSKVYIEQVNGKQPEKVTPLFVQTDRQNSETTQKPHDYSRQKMWKIGLLLLALCCPGSAFVNLAHKFEPSSRRISPIRSTSVASLRVRAQCEPFEQKKTEHPAISSTMIRNMSPLLAIAAGILMEPTAALAAAPEWVEPTRSSLDIFLAVFSTLFFIRIPITWYPQMDLNKMPQALVCG